MSDDDSVHDRDMCFLVDNEFSEQTKGAAHYDQLPPEKKNIKSLFESDMKRVMIIF